MYRRELEINGTPLSFETGKYAKQADGSVIVRMGESVVLVTACASPNPREGIDFLPLTVDYKEYTYASGRIPGGFFKREGKPSEKEVLTSRVIDRPIRPLFPAGWRNESQIIALVLSADANYDPDVLAHQRRFCGARALEHPVPEDDRRRARRPGRRAVRHQPDLRAAQEELARPRDGGQQGRDRDGRGRRQGSDRRRSGAGRSRPATPPSSASSTTIDALAKEAGKPKREVAKKEYDPAFYREVEEKVMIPLADAMRMRDKLANYGSVDQVLERARRDRSPKAKCSARSKRRPSSRSSRKKSCATKCSRRACGSTAASSTRSGRSGRKSACCPASTAPPCSRAAKRRRSSP